MRSLTWRVWLVWFEWACQLLASDWLQGLFTHSGPFQLKAMKIPRRDSWGLPVRTAEKRPGFLCQGGQCGIWLIFRSRRTRLFWLFSAGQEVPEIKHLEDQDSSF